MQVPYCRELTVKALHREIPRPPDTRLCLAVNARIRMTLFRLFLQCLFPTRRFCRF